MAQSQIKSIAKLVKFRLSASVAGSAVFGYIISCKWNGFGIISNNFDWAVMWGVLIGGLLLTFGSNGLNQVIEKDNDAIMDRTANRPLPSGNLSPKLALIVSWIMALLGIFVLLIFTTFAATYAGIISFFIYVFLYTPLKQSTPLSVMVGAIPGALPPLIGYLAFTGTLDYPGTLLFLVQFFWQFAHFWAIAWILHDDYQKVGYWMLPTKSGRSKQSAAQILIYTVLLIVTTMMPIYFVYKNIDVGNAVVQLTLVLALGIMLLFFAFKLYQNLDIKSAKRLMFASLIHNPLIYLTYIIF